MLVQLGCVIEIVHSSLQDQCHVNEVLSMCMCCTRLALVSGKTSDQSYADMHVVCNAGTVALIGVIIAVAVLASRHVDGTSESSFLRPIVSRLLVCVKILSDLAVCE